MKTKTLICGWCGNHRKGELNDGKACSCGGRSWLICTFGCLDDDEAAAALSEAEAARR